MAPKQEPLLEPSRALVGLNLANTEGNFRDRDCGKSKLGIVASKPGDHRSIWGFTKSLRYDIGIEKNQRSGPE